ncbi:MAG: hypothetical protein ACC742_10135 [Thermoanaerobaculales bacterium]
MNWQQLLTSPPPTCAWLLESGQAAVVHRDSKGGLHCAAEAVPDDVFEVGPVGLQSVNEERLGPVLAALKGAAEGARNGAVIVPTAWLRSHLIETDKAPKKQSELTEVVRWRLKKLLPIPPSELRLSVVRVPEAGGQQKLLCLAGVERAVAGIEASFRAVGVEPGLVTTRLFAVTPRADTVKGAILVVQHEAALFSLMLLVDGAPRLLRTKLLPLVEKDEDTGLREVRLALGFIRDDLGVDGEIEVALTVEKPESETALRRWLAEQDGLVPSAVPSVPPCAPSTVADRLGAARLAPAVSVVTEGIW